VITHVPFIEEERREPKKTEKGRASGYAKLRVYDGIRDRARIRISAVFWL